MEDQSESEITEEHVAATVTTNVPATVTTLEEKKEEGERELE